MNKLLAILGLTFTAILPLPAQAFLFGVFDGGTSSELVEEDEQTAAISYPEYAAKHKVRHANISPDGKLFATVVEEKVNEKEIATLRIWNFETKKIVASHRPAPMGWSHGLAFIPDGSGYVLLKPLPDSPEEGEKYRFNEAVVWNMDRTIRHRLSWDGAFTWGCGVAVHPDSQKAAICALKLPMKGKHPDWDFIDGRKKASSLLHYVDSRVILFDLKNIEQIKISDNLTLPNAFPYPWEDFYYTTNGQFIGVKKRGNDDPKDDGFKLLGIDLLNPSHLKKAYSTTPDWRSLEYSPDSSFSYVTSKQDCKYEKEKHECSVHVSARPLQDSKPSDESESEIKKLSFRRDNWQKSLLSVGRHGLVFAGDSVLLHVTEPGNNGFFRTHTNITFKSGNPLAARFMPDGSAIRFVTSGDTSSVSLKSAAELQQLAERYRKERKACEAYREAKELAKVGIWGAMAEKFREGIAAAPEMHGGGDVCFPRFQATDIVFNSAVRKHNPKLAQFGMLQLELIAANEKAGGNFVTRFDAWGEFALLASLAGQPALVAASAEEMKKLLAAGGRAFNKDKAEKHVRVLEGLALADMGREDEAFTLLARDKALKQLEWDILERPAAFWPLLGDRARVAYLLGIDESKVPKRAAVRPPPQPFPDPTGRIINPPGMAGDGSAPAPTLSGSGSGGTAAPTPTPAAGVTILE